MRVMPIDYQSLLNVDQLRAVTTLSQNVRVIAGAGSGKTRALTYRIAFLIDELHVDPSAILALTFTNKAAKEMQDRVCKLIPSDISRFLSVRTFHSFAAYFLRHEASAIGYPPSFTILDEEETTKIIKDIAEENGYKRGDAMVKQAISYIKAKKSQGIKPQEITNTFGPNEKTALQFYREYEDRKYAMLCLDFDDLICKCTEVLESFPLIRQKWCSRYSHILVDEFQDTNDQQYRLMELLSTKDTYTYVVGDPDQTIYTWRGAKQGIILHFPDTHPHCEDIFLSRNYRSTSSILDAANKLIAHNKKRIPKDLFTTASAGDPVTAKRFPTQEEEAAWVAGKVEAIARRYNRLQPDYSKIAILYRASYLTRVFETELASRGIPYRIYGGLRFYQRKEVKDVLSYFNLMVNPKNDVAFDRIVNVPKRNIGETTLQSIAEESHSCGLSEYEYVMQLDKHPETSLSSRAVSALMLLSERIEQAKKQLEAKDEAYSSILRRFITDIGYFDFIAKEQDVEEDRAANVNALFDDIDHYISDHPDSTFEEYLQNVTLLTSQDDINDGNYVSLMTVHVAKGLEFDNVFIIGLNDGVFPNARSVNEREEDDEGIEEERRLAYVAMTRAKQDLYMTCNSSYSYVSDSHGTPSQFFDEAGLKFPPSPYSNFSSYPYQRSGYGNRGGYSSGYSGGFSSRKSGPKVTKQQDFYPDEDYDRDSPFMTKKKVDEPSAPEQQIDWKVGDRLYHDVFGDGKVAEVISGKMIVAEFSVGKKTLLSSHPKLHKLSSEGGKA